VQAVDLNARALNVLLVGKDDGRGGAQRVSLQLLDGLHQAGHHAWLAVDDKHSTDSRVLRIPQQQYRSAWAQWWHAAGGVAASFAATPEQGGKALKLLSLGVGSPQRAVARALGHEDQGFPATRHLLELPPRAPDVLHLHNLHENFFDLRALPALSRRVPTFLTLHDAWLMTGHCALPVECPRWESGCGHCPDLQRYPAIRRDGTHHNWQLRQHIFRQARLHVIAPSEYILDLAQRSVLAAAMVDARVIANGVDTAVFQAGDRGVARATLGLPQQGCIILCASGATGSYKDAETAWAAIRLLGSQPHTPPNTVVVMVGLDGPAQTVGHVRVVCAGYVSDPMHMARYHQAANVLLHTVRAETAGMIITEALCCGAHVVATRVGGIPDVIRRAQAAGLQGRTWLVPPHDVGETVTALHQALAAEPAAANDVHWEALSIQANTRQTLEFYAHARAA